MTNVHKALYVHMPSFLEMLFATPPLIQSPGAVLQNRPAAVATSEKLETVIANLKKRSDCMVLLDSPNVGPTRSPQAGACAIKVVNTASAGNITFFVLSASACGCDVVRFRHLDYVLLVGESRILHEIRQLDVFAAKVREVLLRIQEADSRLQSLTPVVGVVENLHDDHQQDEDQCRLQLPQEFPWTRCNTRSGNV